MTTARRAANGSGLRRSRVPRDRIWTAKDDARYISPLVATPGYRHTVGIARVWHFINVHGFIITGIVFVFMLFATEQWRRIVPTSPLVVSQAWNTWVHYATLHMPPEPNGFYGYNALQQIAYFTVVFVFGPAGHSDWHCHVAGRGESFSLVRADLRWQAIRQIHPFPHHAQLRGFLVVHVTLVVMTGFARNMNHIVMGTDDQDIWACCVGFVGIGVVVLSWVRCALHLMGSSA